MVRNYFFITLLLVILSACSGNQPSITVTVKNPLASERKSETVNVALGTLSTSAPDIVVIDQATQKEILSQLVDANKDSVFEAIMFQVDLKGDESRDYVVKPGKTTIAPSEVKTYGRFVPERYDDFTWENDKVAFRMYGPALKKLLEDGNPAGGISGGLDCWLKKVDYSVINKWYKGYLTDPMYYHNDRGEGLDNYHVGPSLGAGGTGVMINDSLVTSINFTDSHVLLNGPVETKFQLDYDAYGMNDIKVQEQKTISIDLGSNLTKISVDVKGTDVLTTGITLHENDGELTVDSTAAFVDYFAPYFGGTLGNAIVIDPKYYAGYTRVDSDMEGHSIVLLHLKVIDGKIEYYAGFSWSEAKQFAGKADWDAYLMDFAQRIQHPLEVSVK